MIRLIGFVGGEFVVLKMITVLWRKDIGLVNFALLCKWRWRKFQRILVYRVTFSNRSMTPNPHHLDSRPLGPSCNLSLVERCALNR